MFVWGWYGSKVKGGGNSTFFIGGGGGGYLCQLSLFKKVRF